MRRIFLGILPLFLAACGGSGSGGSASSVNTSLDEAQSISDNYSKSLGDFGSVAELMSDGSFAAADVRTQELVAGCAISDLSSDTNIHIEATNGSGTCPIHYLQQVNIQQQDSRSFSGTMSMQYSIKDSGLAADRQLQSHSCTASFSVATDGSSASNVSMNATCVSVTRDHGTFTTQVNMNMASSGSGTTTISTDGTVSNAGKVFSFSIRFDSGSSNQTQVLINGQPADNTTFSGNWMQGMLVF